ncbi:MAG TPA: PAS domain S-box protein [Desulfobacteraceae bacterium]|nr:PAS domain S-box protein [Desulfobacteraceae bacterium]
MVQAAALKNRKENMNREQETEAGIISRQDLVRQFEDVQQHMRELEEGRRRLEKERLTYQKLLDAAPDAVLFVDREGRILEVNARLENVFNYDPGELNGRSIEMLIPERFRLRHRQHVRDFFAHPRQRPMGSQYEIYGRRKNGEEFPADISLNFLVIDGVLYASASVRDITERKALDDKLIRDYHMQRVISEVLKTALRPVPLQEQLGSILELILSVPVLFLEEKGAIYLVNDDRTSMSLAALQGFDDSRDLPCRDIIIGRCLCGEAAGRCKTVYADRYDDRHRLIRDDMFAHGHYCVPIVDNNECVGLLNLYVKEGHKHNGSEEKFITVIADTTALVIRHHRNEKERIRLQEQRTAGPRGKDGRSRQDGRQSGPSDQEPPHRPRRAGQAPCRPQDRRKGAAVRRRHQYRGGPPGTGAQQYVCLCAAPAPRAAAPQHQRGGRGVPAELCPGHRGAGY